ncbi:tlc domain-containing protein 2-like [Gigaspora margarita]|uniref:Tlc domain-containing protein 2-like n=1 Tax=Gigaspora margarita TaxID=4874 RepID=A0A8H4AED8_GIGMA|nr:tlc domain-containing protein 2-like [Gigaspora margarita]
MDSCVNESSIIVLGSFVGFILLNYVSSKCVASCSTFYKSLNQKKRAIWDNTFVSYVHACICSIITPICFYYYPHAWDDMINADAPLCKFQIAFSTGYFFADMFDFWKKNIFMDSPGIWIHHVVVCTTFLASAIICKYSPYLTATLLVEISNIFLHQRKLSLMYHRSKSTTFYKINALFLILTFIFVRFTAHGYLLIRVWNEHHIFGHEFHWRIALFGMVAMNVINLQLFSQLWNSDWSKSVNVMVKQKL